MKFEELFISKTICFLQHPIRVRNITKQKISPTFFTFPMLKISIKNSSLFQAMYLTETSKAKDQRASRKKKTISLNFTLISFLGPNEYTIFNGMFNRSLMPHENPALYPPTHMVPYRLFWELVANQIQKIYDFQNVLKMQPPKRFSSVFMITKQPFTILWTRGITVWTLIITALKKLKYV